ncbi:hypothetical protein CTAYLR_003521 [Chrysophaeum taylorii]|uniref:EF-hand domain-containing protein n=1 Tax=Chrysophaeum taylorii TaxID=2483200 RepID=A0AAD7UDA6_9STRA|nr:hypothetical protein CTAYLR_003521 [Chrysophaeum taylorii]
MTAQEESQLRRVYSLLCDYGAKRQVYKVLRPKEERYEVLRAKLSDEEVAGSELASELQSLSADIDELKDKIQRLEAASDGRITPTDLMEAMKALGKKTTKKEVEAIIWEVDENLDGCVDWNELRLMFQRNIRDQSGLEPSKLFNLVQFCLYDVNDNFRVSVDETMNMLYARYGRVRMEAKLRELFGDDMQETGTQGGEIDFSTYLKAVEKTQLATFLQSAHGKAQIAKAGSVRKLIGTALADQC